MSRQVAWSVSSQASASGVLAGEYTNGRLAVAPQAIFRTCWLFLALSWPLFGVDMFRVFVAPLSINLAVPMVVMFVLLMLGFAWAVHHRSVRWPNLRVSSASILLFLTVGFWSWAFLVGYNVAVPEAKNTAAREVMKLGLGGLSLWTILLLFPLDQRFLNLFWRLILWSSTALLLVLIYQHAVVWGAPSLGGWLSTESREGRNQLVGFLCYVVPYGFAYAFCRRRNLAAQIPFVVLITAWIYAGSRGALLAISAGLLMMVPIMIKDYGWLAFRRFLMRFAVLMGAILAIVSTEIDILSLEFVERFSQLVRPETGAELGVPLNSLTVRALAIQNSLLLFLSAPITGVGLMGSYIFGAKYVPNPYFDGRFWPHNDYVGILAELGIIGWLMFMGIIWIVICNVWRNPARKYLLKRGWVSMGTRGAIVSGLLYLNSMSTVYSTTQLWCFLGLSLIASQIEQQQVKRLGYG